MRNISPLLYVFAAFVAAASGVHAAPMNKCVIDGTVTYQQGLCPSTQARKDPTLEELNAAEKKRRAAAASAAAATPREASPAPNPVSSSFGCDGRKYCSQMRSCSEAKYFLANCPGVKMDGDNDGVPCEEQWCNP
ncbi:excalibur calcium-binding domain-containing protein [uncultured Piscinibacter sp.]|uniref:excalibur calcium-binding domain-containing protein n=1 Tax=uncultured Piscinibacter sp. TaxID=1131835 RepID=UPI002614B5D9|nr:excalibur calcium-binding domain-containing protein [uncultured Piscinibacter sp.]